ncbi:CMP-N-acetylneuraminate-poly-alpha-2,8-sialyltransferase-like [Antedon mediterranea]|uniref:CMP-N-acetylneuraminate-poly-alpha-2, 8-sialyltransferase-like n=1 Tax=Antedon mediterranea TaxID=105859 RepID=UPI003AF78A20
MRLRMPKVKFKPALFFLLVSSSVLFYIAVDVPIAYPMPQRCEPFPLDKAVKLAESGKKGTWDAARKIKKLAKTCLPPDHTLMIYSANNTPENLDFKQGFNVIEYLNFLFDGKSGMPAEMEANFESVKPQKRCAVIGNGGILLGSGCGKEIDTKYDFVMRSNIAPIKNFTSDVGIKTNFTIINLETVRKIYNLLAREKSDPETTAIIEKIRFLNDSIIWYPKGVRFRFYARMRLQTVARKLKDEYKLAIRVGYSWRTLAAIIKWFWSLTEYYTTTGLNLYTIATTFCDEITLYGFYPFHSDSQGRDIQYHYYEDIPYKYENNVHDFPAEFDHLQKLEKIGALKLVTGKCNNK